MRSNCERFITYFHKYEKPCCSYTVTVLFLLQSKASVLNTTSKFSLIKLLYICFSKSLMNTSTSRSAQNCSHCLSGEFWQCSLLFSSSWILRWESLGWLSLWITKHCLDENTCQPQEYLNIEKGTVYLETCGYLCFLLGQSHILFSFFPFDIRS